jgi:NitT/TauT family transport system permease protein
MPTVVAPDDAVVKSAKTRLSMSQRAQRQWSANGKVWLLSLLTFAVLIALWQAFVVLFNVSPLLLPRPVAVFHRIVLGLTPGKSASFYTDIWVTLSEVLVAFVISSIIGILLGMILALSPIIERVAYPFTFAFQATPKIAIAPLIILWAGFGLKAMAAVSIFIAFFPMMVNSLTGFKSAERGYLLLFEGLCASRLRTFIKLRLPGALPFIFVGFELSLVYSLLGVVVAEFVGGQQGMGVRILTYNTNFDLAGEFAVIFVLCIMAVLLQAIIIAVRRRVLRWSPTEARRVRQGRA